MSSTRRAALVALVLLLAFAGIGGRGLWDPDEGRYTNVALNMLESGDWVHPMRSTEVAHWTKPPLAYWAIAASVAAFGYHPWAARLPGALAFLVTVWLVLRIGRRLVPEAAGTGAVMYATMSLPLFASHWISTDGLLSASVALAMLGFVEARWGADTGARRAWLGVMWLALGVGFMAKGPPVLLSLGALVALQWLAPLPDFRLREVFWWPALLLFLGVGLAWYLWVVAESPALAGYFLGTEVVERVAGAQLNRNPEWYGWLKVYLPVLVLGTLPWTGYWLRALRRVPALVRSAASDRSALQAEDRRVLLWLWLLLPLLVFCLARSRMPLYLLPYFPPLAMLAAHEWQQRAGARPVPWRALGAWVVLVLALRFAWAAWPGDKDAAQWAAALQARVAGPIEEVVFVEHPAHYGLHLHLGTGVNVERLSLAIPGDADGAIGHAIDHDLAAELHEAEANQVLVTPQAHWSRVEQQLAALGWQAIPCGAPYLGRVVFQVEPLSAGDELGILPPAHLLDFGPAAEGSASCSPGRQTDGRAGTVGPRRPGIATGLARRGGRSGGG